MCRGPPERLEVGTNFCQSMFSRGTLPKKGRERAPGGPSRDHCNSLPENQQAKASPGGKAMVLGVQARCCVCRSPYRASFSTFGDGDHRQRIGWSAFCFTNRTFFCGHLGTKLVQNTQRPRHISYASPWPCHIKRWQGCPLQRVPSNSFVPRGGNAANANKLPFWRCTVLPLDGFASFARLQERSA